MALQTASVEVDIEICQALLSGPKPSEATWREPSLPTGDGERTLPHILVDSKHRGSGITQRLLALLLASVEGGASEVLDATDQRGRRVIERAIREECLPCIEAQP